MVTVSLKFHPLHPPRGEYSLCCDVAYAPNQGLKLQFKLLGDIAGVLTGDPSPMPRRRDGLWQSTCFEAFIGFEQDAGYREFNVSPSGDWAVYDFSDYRSGMTPTDVAIPPKVFIERSSQWLLIEAHLDHCLLPKSPSIGEPPFRLGLSAILLEEATSMSFWALHHPIPQPDFHHAEGLCLSIPSAPQAFITQDLSNAS